MRPRSLLACSVLASSLLASWAQAEPRQPVATRFGSAAASRLLASGEREARLRAIERLASLSDTRSLEKLVELLEGELAGSRDPSARLVAVRALSRFAHEGPAAEALANVLSHESPRGPLSVMTRDAAAMGLARSGDARALELLTTALRQGGLPGKSAKEALLAHPPAVLLPVQPDAVPPLASELFGELGEMRAKGVLRTTLSRARSAVPMDRAVAIAAAEALAKLGDESVLEVARAWASSDEVSLKLSGARIFAALEAKEAGPAIAALLGMGVARDEALELALAHPSPALVGPLVGIARAGDREGRDKATAALGKLGSAEALAALEPMLGDPERSLAAARALATSEGKLVSAILERALASASSRRRAAEAATARFLLLKEEAPAALEDALSALLPSSDPADRWAGAFGLAVTRPARKAELAGSRDPHLARAAALSMSPEEALRFVPTTALLAYADEPSPMGPWAIRALGFRDGPSLRPRLESQLASSDPVRRAEAARGLGASLRPDVSARLGRAYAFEVDPKVRLAIVEALAERREPRRQRTLELAASLDGDAAVRKAARRALDASAGGEPDDEAWKLRILGLAFSPDAEKAPAP